MCSSRVVIPCTDWELSQGTHRYVQLSSRQIQNTHKPGRNKCKRHISLVATDTNHTKGRYRSEYPQGCGALANKRFSRRRYRYVEPEGRGALTRYMSAPLGKESLSKKLPATHSHLDRTPSPRSTTSAVSICVRKESQCA